MKYIQITPVNWPVYSLKKDDDGAMICTEIHLCGVTDSGEIHYLESDTDGIFYDARQEPWFVQFLYGLPENIDLFSDRDRMSSRFKFPTIRGLSD